MSTTNFSQNESADSGRTKVMSFMEWVIEITDRTLRESRAHVLEAESFHRQRKEEMPKPWANTAVGPRSPSSSEKTDTS